MSGGRRALFPGGWREDLEGALAKQQGGERRAVRRAAEAQEQVAFLEQLLDKAPEGEVRAAVAAELEEARMNLVKTQGISDKLLREIASQQQRIQRRGVIEEWLKRG